MSSYLLFDKYGIDNCEIVWIEDYPCERKEQLTARERYYIENINCVNKLIPGRTNHEYYEANEEKRGEWKGIRWQGVVVMVMIVVVVVVEEEEVILTWWMDICESHQHNHNHHVMNKK